MKEGPHSVEQTWMWNIPVPCVKHGNRRRRGVRDFAVVGAAKGAVVQTARKDYVCLVSILSFRGQSVYRCWIESMSPTSVPRDSELMGALSSPRGGEDAAPTALRISAPNK